MKRLLIFLLLIIFNSPAEPSAQLRKMVVHISITAQHYDYYSPWDKGPVKKIYASGAVVDGNKIITASMHLADHQLIEVQKQGEMKKYNARVLASDYRTGIAFLTLDDRNFFNGLKPVILSETGRVTGEEAIAARWDETGNFREYSARGYGTYMEKLSDDIFETGTPVLVHRMTTGMDNGGYGEPVFLNGKLAGISTGYNEKTGALNVCSAEIIKKMLHDISDGSYSGIPFFSIQFIPLESDINLRAYLGLKPEEQGIYVNNVSPRSSGAGSIKPGDVILSIDGNPLDDRGLYKSESYGSLDFRGLIFPGHSSGEAVFMKVLRGRKAVDISFRLLPFPEKDFLVPRTRYDEQPAYYIFGGLVFQELTHGYMNSAGGSTGSREGARLQQYIQKSIMTETPGLKRLVILNRALPSAINSGYEDKKNIILAAVNRTIPADLADFKKIIESSRERFIKFDFIGTGSIVLEREPAIKSGPAILKKYNISSPGFP